MVSRFHFADNRTEIAKYVIEIRISLYFFKLNIVFLHHFYHRNTFVDFTLIVDMLVSGCTATCWSGVHLQPLLVLFLIIKCHKADFS